VKHRSAAGRQQPVDALPPSAPSPQADGGFYLRAGRPKISVVASRQLPRVSTTDITDFN